MASNNKWIARVLYKLNELFLEGSDFDDRRWIFDWDEDSSLTVNLDNVFNEDRALETLTRAGVIASRSIPNYYREQQLDAFDDPRGSHIIWSDWKTTDDARREYEWVRALDDFDYQNFMRFSELNGFNPTSHGVSAMLEVASGSTPVVKVGNDVYRFPSLAAGSVPQAVISYASKHYGEEITLSTLMENIKNVQLKAKAANLSQFFRKNIFGTGNALSVFAEIHPKSILLKNKALLSATDLSSIQKASTH